MESCRLQILLLTSSTLQMEIVNMKPKPSFSGLHSIPHYKFIDAFKLYD